MKREFTDIILNIKKMTLEEIKNIVTNVAKSDIKTLIDEKEMLISNTKFGTIVGHFAGNSFFFYSNGKELFRDSDKSKAIKFLTNSYNITIK